MAKFAHSKNNLYYTWARVNSGGCCGFDSFDNSAIINHRPFDFATGLTLASYIPTAKRRAVTFLNSKKTTHLMLGGAMDGLLRKVSAMLQYVCIITDTDSGVNSLPQFASQPGGKANPTRLAAYHRQDGRHPDAMSQPTAARSWDSAARLSASPPALPSFFLMVGRQQPTNPLGLGRWLAAMSAQAAQEVVRC